MAWFEQLQQASFRGVPFAVLAGQGKFGRRVAVHEYPFRDKPWVEDLGRGTRKISLTGFLVENSTIYGGGDVLSQREALIAAAETAGQGTLVHPTLGELTVAIPEGGLTIVERWDAGRYFELQLTFIEAGDRIFPSVGTSTGDAVATSADGADMAAGFDFSTGIIQPMQIGSLSVSQVVNLANGWAKQALNLAKDASSLVNLVSSLSGNFGRFMGLAVSLDPTGTVASLIATGAEARALVAIAVKSLNTSETGFSTGTSGTFATAAKGVTAALLQATASPADAVRLLSDLAADTAHAPTQSPVGDLFRRSAVVSLARASANYQPVSSDDGAAVRTLVTGLLDNEITIAGDQGEDTTYQALRTLRQTVVQDLNSRSAALPAVETFSFNAALPALVLAERLYQDPNRADELVQEADPVHPAFMPMRFRALSQ